MQDTATLQLSANSAEENSRYTTKAAEHVQHEGTPPSPCPSFRPPQSLTHTQIAIEGCCHGELDAIYAQIAALEQQHGYSVDLLLICGDFQAVRNHRDLQCMAVPDKYKQLGGFAK